MGAIVRLVVANAGAHMSYTISLNTLKLELADRERLFKKENTVLRKLDDAHDEAIKVYGEARDTVVLRVDRQHDEIIEIKKAIILLEDAPAGV